MAYFTSQIQTMGAGADPDLVYYNATIVNNATATEVITFDPSATFQDTRDTPIVRDASKYQVSVEYFSINGGTKFLPIFIPSMANGSSTNTNYTITFSAKSGANYYQNTQTIVWVPENDNLGLSSQDPQYYFCYTYTHWVNLVNTALRAAWQAVKTAGSIGTLCPFFEFDETTGLFSLYEDVNTSVSSSSGTTTTIIGAGGTLPQPYGDTTSTTGYLTSEQSFVGFDTNLEGLLTNFDTLYYGVGVSWGGGFNYPQNIVLVNPSQLNNKIVSLVSPVTGAAYSTARVYVRIAQDFISTGSLWSPVSSLVLGTQQIPVRMESSAPPVAIGGTNTGANVSSASQFQKVLLETPINALTADLWRGFILYQPLVPTFSSLTPSQQEIKNIDLQIYVRNRLTNALLPLALYNLGSVTLRLCFKRIDAP
jgi:hypothetical protein